MSVWLPLATAAGGYAIKAIDDWRKERREDRRADRQRQHELDDERRHREEDLQRATLLELQEALHELLVVANRSISERRDAAHTAGRTWENASATPETIAREQALMGRVYVLQARVKDERVRELTQGITAVIASPRAMMAGEQEARATIARGAGEAFEAFNMEVGRLLRESY
jgi:hypothetical protein